MTFPEDLHVQLSNKQENKLQRMIGVQGNLEWIHESDIHDFHDSDDTNQYINSNYLDYSKDSNSTDIFYIILEI